MRGKKVFGTAFMLLPAFLWGLAFVAQEVCAKYIGPFTYGAIRFVIGGVILLPVVFFTEKKAKQKGEGTTDFKTLFTGGVGCGLILFGASILQQTGIETTSAGKAGFITALYVVLVPVFGILRHKKTPLSVWVSVGIAVVGLYLLCVNEGFSIAVGDVYIATAAMLYTMHILLIDNYSPKVNGVAMSCIQFFVAAVLSTVSMLMFEHPTVEGISGCLGAILYIGVFSTGIAYTLQIVMQKHTDPTVASLLLSFESVFSALGGWAILHEQLSAKELIGCVLMFAAVILAQLPAEFFAKIFHKTCKGEKNGD